MANLQKKGSNPTIIAVANLFIFGALGYFLIGQNDKGIKILILTAVLSLIGGIGIIIAVLAALDGMEVAKAVEAGSEVDANEYKNEILFKIMKIIDKTAICKTVTA